LDARFASAQLYDPKLKRLRVVAQREFASGFLDQFGEMSITSGTICARAARVQLPILISDVTTDEDWVPFLSFSESAGFGGVLSIPLLSRAGAVTSCHFAGRAKPSGSEMKFARRVVSSRVMPSLRSGA
jgi:GAF domain-containing protein